MTSAVPRDDGDAARASLLTSLAAEVLSSFGKLRVRVTGLSMLPAVFPGDELTVERCDSRDLEPGEIAFFRRGSRLYAHRVVSAKNAAGRVTTRGDRSASADPPVGEEEVLGRVAAIRRGGREFIPSRRLDLGRRAAAALLRYSDRGAGVLLRMRALRAG